MKVATVKKQSVPEAPPFESLVRDAAAVTLELRQLDRVESIKLTAEAFLTEAVKIAQTDLPRLAELRRKLESDLPGIDQARQILRKMIVLFRSKNATRPARELRRYNFLHNADAIAQLAALGSNTFEVAAVAVQITAEKFPEAFGESTSSRGVDEKLIELAVRRDELLQRVAVAWTSSDIESHDVDAERGTAKVCFRITAGAVAIHPLEDCARRLIDWWISNKGTE